jgi:hypothetical protein
MWKKPETVMSIKNSPTPIRELSRTVDGCLARKIEKMIMITGKPKETGPNNKPKLHAFRV